MSPRLRPLLIGLVLTVLLTILGAWHGYLLQRLVIAPGWSSEATTVGTWIVGLGLGSIPVVFVAEQTLPPPWSRRLAWPGSVWMGAAFLLLVGTALSDVALIALGDAWLRARAIAVVGATAVAVAIGMRIAFVPRVMRVEVPLARWPRALDGLRVVQLSDIHIGPILDRAFARRLVDRIAALRPDVVVVTGDLVDGRVEHLRDDVAPFAGLHGELGTFFVTGNHDYYSKADPWCAHVEQALGFTVLRNRAVVLERDGGRFALAGVDDHRGDVSGGSDEDLDAALADTRGLPVVLLAHDPSTFKAASRMAVDLQISGHTHAGQIWPFGLVVRAAIPFVRGLYRRGDATLYVSPGTGFWGPPMRLGTRGEITELVLRAAPTS